MRARAWSALAVVLFATASAGAEPKPKPVDIKPIRDKLVVLQDTEGGIYVALPGKDARLWYGGSKSKALYEQVVTGRFTDGSTGGWDISTWSPRVGDVRPGSVGRRNDGRYTRFCGDAGIELTLVTGDKAKTVLDKASFMSTAMIRRPHLLARDDGGVYYYVDVIRDEYGGKGYRVFVGKKGAMKQRPLTDIATDSAGEVFATKTGDIRIVRDQQNVDKTKTTWVKGEKRVGLSDLDLDINSPLIYKDLGIYTFTGNICENP